jgi:CRISPR-associated helicase Cas3/CRISPR-associated endonuclease Cas3-HD
MNFYAHTADDENGKHLPKSSWQLLKDHLWQVAELARCFAFPMLLETEAMIAGLLHDLGKYAVRFQQRLDDNSIHGINHWIAGARQVAGLKSALLDYAIDGHHTGLPAFGELQQSLRKMDASASARELTGCAETLPELLSRFEADGLRLPPSPPRHHEDAFTAALRTRMLFSCLVDADFLDTERHFDPAAAKQRAVPTLQADGALRLLIDRLGHLAAKSGGGPINELRRRLLEDCLRAAEKPQGLFTLTAPTGSGKTLASLAFALRHITSHNSALASDDPRRLRRVIVVIPYTSIIEQTARVYRDLFEREPEFGPHYVLEHHSAVAPRVRLDGPDKDAEDERLRRARLATENWASPLVVTTSVQFFESLFAHKPGDCRKLHNIARSVVLFDEVQTLPSPLLPSLLSAVRLLTREPYGVTAVFMTATQPAFASAGAALPYGWEPTPIESDRNALAETLRRTRIELPQQDERVPWSELSKQLAAHSQALCVVNTTKDARELFSLLPSENRFHLSARLCPAHRQEKLAEIRRRLDPKVNEPCRLVSTQLIEAGVDVDFPIAFRALGPLDSIIQTAGRCNREGRHPEPCPVIVFRPERDGMLDMRRANSYKVAALKTAEFLARYPDARERLHQPDFYAAYFAELYRLQGPEKAEADKVFDLSAKFNFPEAAKACRLVGDDTRSVLVKWRDGEDLIKKLCREKHLSPDEWRCVQRFSVNLYMGEFIDAQTKGYIIEAIEGVWFWNSKYDDDLGTCHPDLNDYCQ